MTNHSLLLILMLLLTTWTKPASGALISTDIIHVADDIWEYHYSIDNNTEFSIEQFALYFPSDTYQNLVDISTQPDWDILLVQPGAFFPEDDGIFDALALMQGIAPGDTLSGFAVRFSFIGSGNFGAQLFEVYDPISFEMIDSGQTPIIAAPREVPAPASGWLLLLGTSLLLFRLSRSKKPA